MFRTRQSFSLTMLLAILLGAALAVSLAAPDVAAGPAADAARKPANALTDGERAGDWKLLFDGKTTKGWRRYHGKGVPDQWTVVDGVLVHDPKAGKEGGDIVTLGQY